MRIFFSIKDPQTLDLEIARNATDPDGRFATPISRYSSRFPKVVAIFGANASGKTNLLRSIAFLGQLIRDSATWRPDEPLPFLPFGAFDSGESTKLSIEIDGALDEPFDWDERVLFRYDLEIDSDRKRIIRESLDYSPKGRVRRLFQREEGKIQVGKDFSLSQRDPVLAKIKDNTSVISILAQFNHPFSTAIYQSLQYLMTNVSVLGKQDIPVPTATQYYQSVPSCFENLNSEIKRFDLGIEKVTLEQTNEGLQPVFYHAGLDWPINLSFESHGTQRFYSELPRIFSVLGNGGVAVLDELDNDMHPLILLELLKLFQNPKSNPRNAQIILSCHNATLLEYLEKEEVFFVEKEQNAATEVYGLKDVKAVRRDTNIYAKYLAGAFGAVPRVA